MLSVSNSNQSIKLNSNFLRKKNLSFTSVQNLKSYKLSGEDGLILKNKPNFLQRSLIKINEFLNKNYQNAKDCMNISLVGAENIQGNNELKQISPKTLEKKLKNFDEWGYRHIMYRLGESVNGLPTIMYSKDSQLSKEISRSKGLKEFLKGCNYDSTWFGGMILNDNQDLFRSLNRVLAIVKIKDGKVNGYIFDIYDFKMEKHKNPLIMLANSAATCLQKMGIVKNYNIVVPVETTI